ncbi:cytochrome c3 family protein [Calderihabitans maritimus]|uniref:Doubled CXXCH motif domain-containing protein n=1 Tax=Calderihabitans maritimus TaxID=1246530 RepID=A0A1Z5HVL7_9FIRM|nr:cytochrome c3 family protein [Calderihabitans maritimus]GAW93589.1 hypothetical protein TherJR_2096 [Calderihabitans maritimus]
MKRLSILVVLSLVFLLALGAGSALAATNGPHGNYSADTDACGQCHSTHAGNAANLIKFTLSGSYNAVYETCTACHSDTGSSKYDVINGVIYDPSANAGAGGYWAASGGGFDNVLTGGEPAADLTGVVATTSSHDVKGTGEIFAPGGDSTTGNGFTEFSCSNCHDPHGTSNSRQLISATTVTITVDPTTELKDEAIKYEAGINAFCGSCHTDFNVGTGSGDTAAGTYSTHTRHAVGVDPATYPGTNAASWTTGYLSQPSATLPLQFDGVNQQLTCLTCHYAHGTAATNIVTFDRVSNFGGTSNSSTLLRQNNRGVCESCHNK